MLRACGGAGGAPGRLRAPACRGEGPCLRPASRERSLLRIPGRIRFTHGFDSSSWGCGSGLAWTGPLSASDAGFYLLISREEAGRPVGFGRCGGLATMLALRLPWWVGRLPRRVPRGVGDRL